LRKAGNRLKTKTTPRRKRRLTQDVIDRILRAASDEFEQHGYDGATTAAIARKANVVEPLIFTNFGSKSELFHASIFQPLDKHLIDFCAAHSTASPQSKKVREELTRKYIAELEEFIDKHSRKFISLFFEQTYRNTDHRLDNIEGIQDYLSHAASLAIYVGEREPKIDLKVMARLSFATIFSCVIFRDWLFPKGVATKEEIFSSLIDFVVDGLHANAKP
jgi:AcrR family transcriptional regulator